MNVALAWQPWLPAMPYVGGGKGVAVPIYPTNGSSGACMSEKVGNLIDPKTSAGVTGCALGAVTAIYLRDLDRIR